MEKNDIKSGKENGQKMGGKWKKRGEKREKKEKKVRHHKLYIASKVFTNYDIGYKWSRYEIGWQWSRASGGDWEKGLVTETYP